MRQRGCGDTVIEVMFSFTVLSLLVVTTYMVMNRGTQIAQRSLEVTLVRQQIDSQISLIRYAHAHNTEAWQEVRSDHIVNSGTLVDPAAFVQNNGRCPTVEENDLTSGRRAFFLAQNSSGTDVRLVDVSAASYGVPNVYSQASLLADNPRAQGLFIQVARAETNPSTGASAGGTQGGVAYDVYVNACWDSVGASVPSTIGTVTRIYNGTN